MKSNFLLCAKSVKVACSVNMLWLCFLGGRVVGFFFFGGGGVGGGLLLLLFFFFFCRLNSTTQSCV